MEKKPKVCIIGAESWGSAIATAVGNNVLKSDFDKRVHMYVYDELVQDTFLSEVINGQHENIKYLPGIQLPENLIAVNDLLKAAQHADILVFATPQKFIKSYCNLLSGHVKSSSYAVSLIKGLDSIGDGHIDLHSHTISKQLGIPCYTMMCASSAMEMAQGKLCEITVGCNNAEHAEQLTSIFQTDNCKVVAIDDVDGVELCNTLKDVLALGAGIIDGLRLGDNARVTAVHLGLKEMMRFIKGFYPNTQLSTFFESCLIAHSVASCYADKNVTFAKNFVISGKTIQEMEENLLKGKKLLGPLVVEEVNAFLEKEKKQHKFPLFTVIHKICQNMAPPESIIDTLRTHPDLCNCSIRKLMNKERNLENQNNKQKYTGIDPTPSSIWNPFIPIICPRAISLEEEPELFDPSQTSSVPKKNAVPHKVTLWVKKQPNKQVHTTETQHDDLWYDQLDVSDVGASWTKTNATSWLGNDYSVDNENEAPILLSSAVGNEGGDVNGRKIAEKQMSAAGKMHGLSVKVKNSNAGPKTQSESKSKLGRLTSDAAEPFELEQEFTAAESECLDKTYVKLGADDEQISYTVEGTKQKTLDMANNMEDEPKLQLKQAEISGEERDFMPQLLRMTGRDEGNETYCEDEPKNKPISGKLTQPETKDEPDVILQLRQKMTPQGEGNEPYFEEDAMSDKLNKKLAALHHHEEQAEINEVQQNVELKTQYVEPKDNPEQLQSGAATDSDYNKELESAGFWKGHISKVENAESRNDTLTKEDNRTMSFYDSDKMSDGQVDQEGKQPAEEWNWLQNSAKLTDKHDDDRSAEFYLNEEHIHSAAGEAVRLDLGRDVQDPELVNTDDATKKRVAQEPATPEHAAPTLPERPLVATPSHLKQPGSEPPAPPQTNPLPQQQQERKVLPEQATRRSQLEAARRKIQKMAKELIEKHVLQERNIASKPVKEIAETHAKETKPKYANVEYKGPNPYGREPTLPPEPPTEVQQLGSKNMRRKLVVNPYPPFNPPLNPRVPTPRPPFDGRPHEYHTLACCPPPDLLRTHTPARPLLTTKSKRFLSTTYMSRTARLLQGPGLHRVAMLPAASLVLVFCACSQISRLTAKLAQRDKTSK